MQKTFTEASKDLFTATEKQSYFGEIKIVVPEHWKNTDAEIISPKEITEVYNIYKCCSLTC